MFHDTFYFNKLLFRNLHNQFKNSDKTMVMEELKWFDAALHHSLLSHRYKLVSLCTKGAFECNFMQGFS